MLLALWFDFWTPASWVPGSTSVAPVVVISQGAGSGRYERAKGDFWEERERMMARYAHMDVREIPVNQHNEPKAAKIISKVNRVVDMIHKMPDMARLVRLQNILDDLAGQLDKLVLDSDEDALLALLL